MLKISNKDSDWSPKYFGVVVGLFCALYMITMAINSKIFDFHGMILPAGIIVFPICAILTDLLTEVYGFNRTRQAIWTTIILIILFAFFTQIAIWLKPAGFWQNQQAFEAVFSISWRLAAAGCLAWVAGEFSNSYIMSKMKVAQNARHMSVRFVGSTIVGQFFDTAVFVLVAFAGTMPWKAFFTMIVTAWIYKVVYEIVALPLSIPITKWVKNREGIEHFDKQELKIV